MQQILGDTSSHNFLEEVENIYVSGQTHADTVGGTLYGSMLTDLENNQATSASGLYVSA